MAEIPQFFDFMQPTIDSLRMLGGSATNEELMTKVVEVMKLSDEQVSVMHAPNDSRTAVEYRAAWARTYLKKSGYLDNSERGVWTLTERGQAIQKLNIEEILSIVRSNNKNHSTIEKDEEPWKKDALNALLGMKPDAFERLCKRLLHEEGFTNVKVTGKTGDGGVDGEGFLQMGLVGFRVIFQAKRYQGSVASKIVREFRGAMQGRADKGLIITTGTFTQDSKQEASRVGNATIDLVDGEALIELLKKHKLGLVQSYVVDSDWFGKI